MYLRAIPAIQFLVGDAILAIRCHAASARGAADHEPTTRAAARRGGLGPAPNCATSPPCSRPLCTESGPDLPMLRDGHHRMTPSRLRGSARTWSRRRVRLEDCIPAENQDTLAISRQPLSVGCLFSLYWMPIYQSVSIYPLIE